MNRLAVASSPHRRSQNSTTRIMLDVLIALVPAFIAANIIFGLRAALVTLTCVASCVLFEYLTRKIMKRDNTISDLSAAVTGVLLAYNLPVTIPLWMAVVGSFFAIVVVKQLFGGIGQNFANPAITARVILLVSFSGQMTTWAQPFFYRSSGADVITGATPLVQMGTSDMPGYLDLFLGVRGGCLGETSVLALLIGGIYLVARRVIHPVTPITFVGTVFLFSVIFGTDPVAQIMSGGLMLGAIFMATDYSTSPVTTLGKIVFALGCGTLTIIIRQFGSYPEGVSFAILFMNILVPYIDKGTKIKPFGGKKMRVARDIVKPVVTLAIIALVVSSALVFTYNLTKSDESAVSEEVQAAVNDLLGEGGEQVEFDAAAFEENKLQTVFKDASGQKLALVVTPKGYGGDIEMVVAVDKDGKITGTRVTAQTETPDLGSRITEEEFQKQFVGKIGELTAVKNGTAKGEGEIDAIAGATISSKGFTDGVNKALAAFEQLKGALS